MELVMTMVIVGLTAVPIAFTVGSYIQSADRARKETIVLNLARMEMERCQLLSFNTLESATFVDYEGQGYTVVRDVVMMESQGAERLKSLSVTVTDPSTGESLVNLITYVARQVSYGV